VSYQFAINKSSIGAKGALSACLFRMTAPRYPGA